ncbi:MAG: APC family permease [Bacillota bacterium]
MAGTKKLGLFSAVSTCVGLIVATSCLVSLGTGSGLAGAGFAIPLAIAVVLNMFIALSFGELHAMMPNVTGGMGQYTATALGPVPSIISNISAYVFCMAFAASAEAVMCGLVFTQAFAPDWNPLVVSTVVTLILLAANFRGIDMFARIQNVTVTLLIGSLAALAILSFFMIAPGQPVTTVETPAITGFGDLAGLAAIGFWLFIGVEFVIPISKELRNPKRDVLLAMVIGLVVLFVVQLLLGIGMTNYVPLSVLSSEAMPHIVFAQSLLGDVGKYWMGIITLLAGVSTLNTVLASSTRITAGMAEGGMLPRFFAKENKKGVPFGGLLLLTGSILGIVLTGLGNSADLITMILTGSCFWLVSYIITHVNVLVLRRRYPQRAAAWKFKLFGIPQIIGIIGCVYMIINISPDPDAKTIIFTVFGIALGLLITYATVWTKFVMKKGIFEHVPIEAVIAGGPVGREMDEPETQPGVAAGKSAI